MKWTDIEYVSVARCKSIWTGQTIDESVICADKDDASICSGDSGGPLVIEEDGEQRLIGEFFILEFGKKSNVKIGLNFSYTQTQYQPSLTYKDFHSFEFALQYKIKLEYGDFYYILSEK